MKFAAWFIGIIAILIVGIFGVILIRNVVSNLLNGSPNRIVTRVKPTDYAKSGTTFRMFTFGPVVAPENHREIQIDITSTTRTATIFAGYQGSAIKREALPNTIDSYNAFVQALQNSGFTQERLNVVNRNFDGECPRGSRYNFVILDGATTVSDLWTTSCAVNITGTFGGNFFATSQLFQRQIPDYSTFTGGNVLVGSGVVGF